MKNQPGFSLAVALAMVLLLFSLSIVALKTATSNSALKGGIYAQVISKNVAETGPHRCADTVINDAENNFMTILDQNNNTCSSGPDSDLNYISGFVTTYDVEFRDNDDLDWDDFVDTDGHLLLYSDGQMSSGAFRVSRTQIAVLAAYRGGENEYAQDGGGSKNSNQFRSETNISDNLNVSTSGDSNAF